MASCDRPKAVVEKFEETILQEKPKEKEKRNMIMVGRPAPKFTAPAFYNGEFTEESLENYKGQWVVLCFYPGDFTFV